MSSWISDKSISTKEVLLRKEKEFLVLDPHGKIKLLLSNLSVKKQADFQEIADRILQHGLEDMDDWVRVVSELIHSNLHGGPPNAQLQGTIEAILQHIESQDPPRVPDPTLFPPLECLYLTRDVLPPTIARCASNGSGHHHFGLCDGMSSEINAPKAFLDAACADLAERSGASSTTRSPPRAKPAAAPAARERPSFLRKSTPLQVTQRQQQQMQQSRQQATAMAMAAAPPPLPPPHVPAPQPLPPSQQPPPPSVMMLPEFSGRPQIPTAAAHAMPQLTLAPTTPMLAVQQQQIHPMLGQQQQQQQPSFAAAPPSLPGATGGGAGGAGAGVGKRREVKTLDEEETRQQLAEAKGQRGRKRKSTAEPTAAGTTSGAGPTSAAAAAEGAPQQPRAPKIPKQPAGRGVGIGMGMGAMGMGLSSPTAESPLGPIPPSQSQSQSPLQPFAGSDSPRIVVGGHVRPSMPMLSGLTGAALGSPMTPGPSPSASSNPLLALLPGGGGGAAAPPAPSALTRPTLPTSTTTTATTAAAPGGLAGLGSMFGQQQQQALPTTPSSFLLSGLKPQQQQQAQPPPQQTSPLTQKPAPPLMGTGMAMPLPSGAMGAPPGGLTNKGPMGMGMGGMNAQQLLAALMGGVGAASGGVGGGGGAGGQPMNVQLQQQMFAMLQQQQMQSMLAQQQQKSAVPTAPPAAAPQQPPQQHPSAPEARDPMAMVTHMFAGCNRVDQAKVHRAVDFLTRPKDPQGQVEEILIHEEERDQAIESVFFLMDHRSKEWKKVLRKRQK